MESTACKSQSIEQSKVDIDYASFSLCFHFTGNKVTALKAFSKTQNFSITSVGSFCLISFQNLQHHSYKDKMCRSVP